VVVTLGAAEKDVVAAAHKARQASSLARARASVSESVTAELRTERVLEEVKAVKPEIEDWTAEAKDAADEAERQQKKAKVALDQVKALAETAAKDAAEEADDEVHRVLQKEFDRLDAWRNTYLVDPQSEALKKASAAAEPYKAMIGQIRGRMGEFYENAQAMSGQAKSLSAQAQALARTAQGEQSSGETIAAAMDIAKANAMAKQAQQAFAAGQYSADQVSHLNTLIPEYLQQAYMAKWRTAYEADKKYLPIPPVNPNYAFTAPPPMALLSLDERPFPALRGSPKA